MMLWLLLHAVYDVGAVVTVELPPPQATSVTTNELPPPQTAVHSRGDHGTCCLALMR
jgi:hypothetical protein